MNDTGQAKMPKLIKINSLVKAKPNVRITTSDDLIKIIENFFRGSGRIAAWLDYKVRFGYWRDSKINMSDNTAVQLKFLEQLRVFNQESELYIWRTAINQFNLRLRVDSKEGSAIDAIDAYGLLWGKVKAQKGLATDFSLLEDTGRKLRMILPVKAEINKRLYLKTRNYIGIADTGQAGYIDSRFVEIIERG